MILIGCEGPVNSDVEPNDIDIDESDSGNYYVDRVPASGIPIIEQLNNGDDTTHKIAEAFNKYDAIYLVGAEEGGDGIRVAVPPGKTLYVAPGSKVARFDVASGVSKGDIAKPARDAGLNAEAGPGTLVVLDGATAPLSGASTVGGLLQVNVGGIISGLSATIAGSGKVIVGGKVSIDAITVAGEVYVAQGDGKNYGLVQANIDTTYLALATLVPDGDGKIYGSSKRSDDFYAFENAEPDPSRDVTVDGVVIGNITSGGNVRVAENNRVSLLNDFYGYVAGPPGSNGDPSDATIICYGNAEILGNVVGKLIAKGAVALGSKSETLHRAQVRSTIYSRAGNVVIGKRANSGDIVAYQGSVTIEEGGAATGVDTYCGNYGHGKSVNRGDVMVRGRVGTSVGDSSGSGNIRSGGSVLVAPWVSSSSDFAYNGYVDGSVNARRSAAIDGVVLGSLDTESYPFDGTETDTQNVIVNGYVGGRVTAGGALAVADHHEGAENSNAGSISGITANGYVGGGAAVHSRNGAGPSIIRGLVEGGSLYVGSLANVTIAGSARVDAFDSDGVAVGGTLAIEAPGELDVDEISEIYIGAVSSASYVSGSSLAADDVYAHASGLANGGRFGPSESGITIAPGVKIYTQTPVAVPGSIAGAALDTLFRDLAASTVIHTNAAPPPVLDAAGLTVGLNNIVTLTQDTLIAGAVEVNGLLKLDGYELAVGSVIALAAGTGAMHNYSSVNDSNGCLYFGDRYDPFDGNKSGSLQFTGAAALNGLSPAFERIDFDTSNNQYNDAPLVIEVETPYSNGSSYSVVAEFAPPCPPTVRGGPGGNFAPGANAVLMGASYGLDYINKDSRFVWKHTVYTP
jgi:hypothetical protein